MTFVDHNGTGEWSRQRIAERYLDHCTRLGIVPRQLVAREHISDEGHWIYPIMDSVIEGMTAGDLACITLGVELVETDQKMPFGLILKYQTARALRRTPLQPEHVLRLRKRIVFMLIAGMLPRYFTEYCKLLRTIGVAELWPELDACVPRDNERTMRHYLTLRKNDTTAPKA